MQSEFPFTRIRRAFDSVLFFEVIEHVPDDKKSLDKIHDLLANHGLLILSTPSINAPIFKLGLANDFDKEVGHLRRYNIDILKKMIRNAGFKIIDTKKTEGAFRNFLFINSHAGKLIRFLNFSKILSDIATGIDDVFLKLLGESNYIIVARKVEKKKKRKEN